MVYVPKLINKPKSFKANIERNEKLNWYWKRNYTIEKTSASTGIPHTSVEYYFKKFNNYAKEGKPIAFGVKDRTAQNTEQPDGNILFNVLVKTYNLAYLTAALKDGKFEQVYYLLSCFKLIEEMEDRFFATEEEKRQYFEYIKGIQPMIPISNLVPSKSEDKVFIPLPENTRDLPLEKVKPAEYVDKTKILDEVLGPRHGIEGGKFWTEKKNGEEVIRPGDLNELDLVLGKRVSKTTSTDDPFCDY